MPTTSICLYFPKNPVAFFEFLSSVWWHFVHLDHAEFLAANPDVVIDPKRVKTGEDIELLVWVDNDDHATSKEFYTVRKYVSRGLNLKVFINPAPRTKDEAFSFLGQQATGQDVWFNTKELTNLAALKEAVLASMESVADNAHYGVLPEDDQANQTKRDPTLQQA